MSQYRRFSISIVRVCLYDDTCVLTLTTSWEGISRLADQTGFCHHSSPNSYLLILLKAAGGRGWLRQLTGSAPCWLYDLGQASPLSLICLSVQWGDNITCLSDYEWDSFLVYINTVVKCYYLFKNVFWCGPFFKVFYICYNIASVLCFGFSLFFDCKTCEKLAPWLGITSAHLALEEVVTPGLPGKSLRCYYFYSPSPGRPLICHPEEFNVGNGQK